METVPRTCILAGGVLRLCWAVRHLAFPRLFRRGEALAALDRVNQGTPRALNLCPTVWRAVPAASSQLAAPPLGRTLCAGLAAFWLLRLVLQSGNFGGRDPRSLVLSLFFALTATTHALAQV